MDEYLLFHLILWELLLEDAYTDPHIDSALFYFRHYESKGFCYSDVDHIHLHHKEERQVS